ncbi:hypothetical protein LB941_07370 [Ligilactobacillus sp. WILCCON 0076]|uniref:Uncharacterized protein n=1 Tax=Ligilactobacillus ubinensis TaxID=2876789 RepID=A0A9X2FMM4_9LACO|nr:hypothetical protein [Ligilactobacillus ubinensis]MCP0887153.1 hypothetical protein [Ligilactobacillus ubinensis]
MLQNIKMKQTIKKIDTLLDIIVILLMVIYLFNRQLFSVWFIYFLWGVKFILTLCTAKSNDLLIAISQDGLVILVFIAFIYAFH